MSILPKVLRPSKKLPMSPGVQAILVKQLQATLDELTAAGVANANRRKAVKAELARAMRGEW
jgi:hypothetical protein